MQRELRLEDQYYLQVLGISTTVFFLYYLISLPYRLIDEDPFLNPSIKKRLRGRGISIRRKMRVEEYSDGGKRIIGVRIQGDKERSMRLTGKALHVSDLADKDIDIRDQICNYCTLFSWAGGSDNDQGEKLIRPGEHGILNLVMNGGKHKTIFLFNQNPHSQFRHAGKLRVISLIQGTIGDAEIEPVTVEIGFENNIEEKKNVKDQVVINHVFRAYYSLIQEGR